MIFKIIVHLLDELFDSNGNLKDITEIEDQKG